MTLLVLSGFLRLAPCTVPLEAMSELELELELELTSPTGLMGARCKDGQVEQVEQVSSSMSSSKFSWDAGGRECDCAIMDCPCQADAVDKVVGVAGGLSGPGPGVPVALAVAVAVLVLVLVARLR